MSELYCFIFLERIIAFSREVCYDTVRGIFNAIYSTTDNRLHCCSDRHCAGIW